jgi:hypothetical protein
VQNDVDIERPLARHARIEHRRAPPATSSTEWPRVIPATNQRDTRLTRFVERQKIFVAGIKTFVAWIERFVAGINIRDGGIRVPLLRDDVDDADSEKINAPITSIDDFDASLTPSMSPTLAPLATAIARDTNVHRLQQKR